jgi:hypothetical protein
LHFGRRHSPVTIAVNPSEGLGVHAKGPDPSRIAQTVCRVQIDERCEFGLNQNAVIVGIRLRKVLRREILALSDGRRRSQQSKPEQGTYDHLGALRHFVWSPSVWTTEKSVAPAEAPPLVAPADSRLST